MRIFKTPLVFSVQEAKGLEYQNIIILNFVSGNSKEFREITAGVTAEQIDADDLVFSRGKDKSDKSPEAYKIFINSLYVAITRAINRLYILETSDKHEILGLLGLANIKERVSMKEEVSSMDEWKEEARKLDMQGKTEQAEEIRKSILEVHEPEWESLTPAKVDELKREALDPDLFNKKAKDILFHYAIVYSDHDCLDRLSELKYRKADRRQPEGKSILHKYYGDYERDNVSAVEKSIREYGVDYRDFFNRTPLHPAVDMGSKKILDLLLQYGANPSLCDNLGKIPLQIALYQSYDSKDHFQTLKPLLPKLVTDHIKIKVDDRMIKIGNHKIEYFLLHFFIALQEDIIDECDSDFLAKRGVRAVDLERIVKEYPDSFLQEFRKKRSYLSSNLSKHELDSTNLYNKKLFKRIYTGGFYELNPDLAIWVNDQWISAYDIMQAEAVKVPTQEEELAFIEAYTKQLREERRRRRERGLLGGAWYDDDDDDA